MDIFITLPWNATLQPSLIESISTIGTVLISLLALGFGLYNFWWGNWRTGEIIVSDPLIYAIQLDGGSKPEREQGLQFWIPLIFLNTGGAARFIQDLRLTLRQGENESNELYFVRDSTSMDSEASGTLAQQFAIEGHKAYSTVLIFYRDPGNLAPSTGACKAKLEAKIDDKNWQKLHEFDIHIYPDQNLHEFHSCYCDGRDME